MLSREPLVQTALSVALSAAVAFGVASYTANRADDSQRRDAERSRLTAVYPPLSEEIDHRGTRNLKGLAAIMCAVAALGVAAIPAAAAEGMTVARDGVPTHLCPTPTEPRAGPRQAARRRQRLAILRQCPAFVSPSRAKRRQWPPWHDLRWESIV